LEKGRASGTALNLDQLYPTEIEAMNDEISPTLAKVIFQLQKQSHKRWCEHQALLKIVKNSLPYLPPEVRTEFLNYAQYEEEIAEPYMSVMAKKIQPSPARLDVRPPFSSNQASGSAP
jgi:hypothetical protein